VQYAGLFDKGLHFSNCRRVVRHRFYPGTRAEHADKASAARWAVLSSGSTRGPCCPQVAAWFANIQMMINAMVRT